MNKLRSAQMLSMLLTSAAFPLLCRTHPFTVEDILGAAIAAVFQILLCPLLLLPYRKGFSFGKYAESHRLLPLLFVLYFLWRGGSAFVQMRETAEDIALPFSGALLAAALIALVCVYTVSLGIHAMARSSTVILGILLLTLVVMGIGATAQAKPQNFSLSPSDTIWQGFLRNMANAEELPLLFLLLDFTEARRFRRILPLWIGKFFLVAYPSLLGMAVLGSRMQQANHPFFAAVAVSQPFSTQRVDAIYLVVFVMLCVLRITLFAASAAHLLRLCFPKWHYHGTLCLLLMLGIAWAAAGSPQVLCIQLCVGGFLTIGVPLFLLLFQKRRCHGV